MTHSDAVPTTPRISCGLPPGPDTPSHAALAEELGYSRVWLYDSSTAFFDPWMSMALCARETSTIGLAVGVCVPVLRHVTVTASALVTANSLAPGRITLGIGAGGSGTIMIGQKSSKWRDIVAYAQAINALLRGETVTWDGAAIRLCHGEVDVASMPEIPIIFGAEGPKGEAAAHEHADGISTVWLTPERDFDWSCRVVFGTVLDEGEEASSDRAFAAAAPGGIAPMYHYAHSTGNREMLSQLPNGDAWAARADEIVAEEGPIAIWDGHCIALSDLDRDLIPKEIVGAMSTTGTAEEVRARLEGLGDGWSEFIYQPAGPDIERELRAFAAATMPVAAPN